MPHSKKIDSLFKIIEEKNFLQASFFIEELELELGALHPDLIRAKSLITALQSLSPEYTNEDNLVIRLALEFKIEDIKVSCKNPYISQDRLAALKAEQALYEYTLAKVPK